MNFCWYKNPVLSDGFICNSLEYISLLKKRYNLLLWDSLQYSNAPNNIAPIKIMSSSVISMSLKCEVRRSFVLRTVKF
ncbi:hypothetical protein JCM19301_2670 [Jejuia pallidilutea]|uniref:Uncharacterized protein n=1 Tax=Jejuia pallidilutea TaxID=504487 RepID=A0A090W291_9FLAO|nr:hypothetical protein JCM19301_2670 [Jejuia pallidilutea]GAL71021.1 hypothetical protein JCM19302_2976 [Jejuia pallidilutea]GAL90047.1 hypothetical protein JCM19538_787 [Jejuia pallidilutea]